MGAVCVEGRRYGRNVSNGTRTGKAAMPDDVIGPAVISSGPTPEGAKGARVLRLLDVTTRPPK
ncbi:MAG: hypothetical protein Ct9H300mP25_15890 [Acidobacteriota bacterium]|nr:MAG: hypothetical protein Ct9H300mP25_15890 [Acidobacteriota bacterium]